MNVIQAYNAKVNQFVTTKKIGKPTFPIFLGVELEYEVITPINVVDKVTMHNWRNKVGVALQPTIKTFAFTKHDGSLKNGFEVVTVPMSLRKHQTYWNEFFKLARRVGIEVKATCGMHVHVSKEPLTPFQIGKMLVFLFSKKNYNFIKLIAGRRPPPAYAEIREKRVGDVNKHKIRKSVLNLTNPNTVEFRMFKGTLDKTVALKNIEFCDALVRFTWPSIVGYADLKKNGVKLFCDFVYDNRKDYPHLASFLAMKKFIKLKKIPIKYKNPKTEDDIWNNIKAKKVRRAKSPRLRPTKKEKVEKAMLWYRKLQKTKAKAKRNDDGSWTYEYCDFNNY